MFARRDAQLPAYRSERLSDMNKAATHLAVAELERLTQFMYLLPVGLVQCDLEGQVSFINPLAVQLLMPLARRGDTLKNVLQTFEPVAPELRHLLDTYREETGMVVNMHKVIIASTWQGEPHPTCYAVSIFKLSGDAFAWTVQDISESVRRDRLLQRHEAWLNAIVAGVKDYALTIVDEQGCIDHWNDSLERVTGFSQDDVCRRPYSFFFKPDAMTMDRIEDQLHEARTCGLSLSEGWMRRADGSDFWGHSLITPLDPMLHPTGYSLVLRDITDSRESLDAVLKAALIDQLTGVANRRSFFEVAELELARYARKPRPIALLLIDIDHFKLVNDNHGHAAGDAVIVSLARLLQDSVRSIDIVARLGGEEFVILLPSTSADMAERIAERIRRKVAALRVETEAGDIHCTVSIGVTEVGAGTEEVTKLLASADKALYAAKNAGRNRVMR